MFVEIRKYTVHGTTEPTTIDHTEISGLAPSSRTTENGEPTTRIHLRSGQSFRVAGDYRTVQTDLKRATKKAIPVVGEAAPVSTSRI